MYLLLPKLKQEADSFVMSELKHFIGDGFFKSRETDGRLVHIMCYSKK